MWSLHYYLARVISESVTRLRDYGHGYPAGSSVEEWNDILTRIAEPLAVDLDEWPDDMSVEDHVQWDAEVRAGQKEALRLLTEHFDSLWD